MSRTLICWSLALWASASAPLSAMQGDQRAERQGGKKEEQRTVEFDWPERDAGTRAEADALLSASELVQRAMPAMISWPKEGGENAVRALVVRADPEELKPILRNILRNGTVLERAASARALCLLRDAESRQDIEKLFFDRRQSSRIRALLFSLSDLDVDPRADPTAKSPPSEATLALVERFVASKSSILRRAAMQFYRSLASADIDKIRAVYHGSVLEEVRTDLFELLDDLDDPRIVELAMQALGERHAPMAEAVNNCLVARLNDSIAEDLVQCAREDQGRRGLHALLVLAASERRTRKPRVPEEFFEPMLEQVRSSDPLLRATACITCATIAFRDDGRIEVLQETILPSLMDTVIRGGFFSDFRVCIRQSVALLELITGERLGSSIPAWREYWETRAGTRIGSLRELSSIRPDVDAPSVELRLERGRANGEYVEELVLLGRNYRPQIHAPNGPEGVLLPRAPMESLLVDLERRGFFRSRLPRELAEVDENSLRLSVELLGRVRTLSATADDEAMATWRELLWSHGQESLWQLLLARDESFGSLYQQEEAWWLRQAERGDRVRHVIDLALVALRSGSEVKDARALDVLERLEEFDEAVAESQLIALCTEMFRPNSTETRTGRIFSLVAHQPGDATVDALVEALVPRGESGLRWLSRALRERGEAESRLDDPRSFVRQAALDALAEGEQIPEEKITRLASTDVDPQVRSRALRLLADMGSGLGADVLIEQARSKERSVRTAALRALGKVDDPRALDALGEALFDEDIAVSQAALEGLGRRGDEKAAAMLSSVVVAEGVRSSRGYLAMAALRGLDERLAVPALRALSDRQDESVAREARYGLAEHGEMTVVPWLLRDLEDPSLNRRALSILTVLFSQDLGADPGAYRALWEADPSASRLDHFAVGLRAAGYSVPEDVDWSDSQHWPLLAEVVEDTRWFLRRSASELLEEHTGTSVGHLPVNADAAACKASAEEWRQVLAGRSD